MNAKQQYVTLLMDPLSRRYLFFPKKEKKEKERIVSRNASR